MIYEELSRVFKNKNVLITGDTGFKGSWLAIWLLHLGAKVYGYAMPPKSTTDNYVKTGLNNKIKHTDGDIRNLDNVKEYLGAIEPEFVFHLAAQPLVLDSFEDPVTTFETNTLGTMNILEAIRKTDPVKAAVIVTTDKVYENGTILTGCRESDPLGGSDPYSASKAGAEIIVKSYNESFFNNGRPVAVATARAGNVIGGGDHAENRLVPDIFRCLSEGKDLLLRNPYHIRPWQFVLEPLRGYLMLAAKLYNEGKGYRGAWNFGPDSEDLLTVKELAELFAERLGNGRIVFKEGVAKYEESEVLRLNNSKAAELLNWRPVLDIKESVEMTIEGYKDENESGNLFDKRTSQIITYTDAAEIKNAEYSY